MRRLAVALFCAFVARSASAGAPDCGDCTAAFEVETTYTGDLWRQASGGIATGSRYLDNLDVTVAADGNALFGLEGMSFFGYALYNNGHVFADALSGAAQGVTNIEAVDAVRLYELWSEWRFGPNEQSLRFGLYDLNSEFDSIETAGVFINPSHGIGADFSQSGVNGPSIFPVTSLGLRAMQSFGEWSVQVAALDGVPGDPAQPERTTIKLSSEEGALLVGELNYRSETGFRAAAGYWRYTADFDDLVAVNDVGAPRRRNDNAGAYAILESPVLRARGPDRGLRLFMRVGEAQAHLNPIERYLGAGAVYSGVFAPEHDELGVALAIAQLGDPFRHAQADSGVATDARETNYELTYRFEVTKSVAFQFDAQYIDNPGMDPSLGSGWAFGLRFEVGSVLLRL